MSLIGNIIAALQKLKTASPVVQVELIEQNEAHAGRKNYAARWKLKRFPRLKQTTDGAVPKRKRMH